MFFFVVIHYKKYRKYVHKIWRGQRTNKTDKFLRDIKDQQQDLNVKFILHSLKNLEWKDGNYKTIFSEDKLFLTKRNILSF